MAEITAGMVKDLREKTGAGMMDCKKALAQTNGDMEQAIDFLRKKGIATAQKRAGRSVSEGSVQSYIHMGGKIGVLVEINCETDFVAKNTDFLEFCKDIAMHIAATSPLAVRPEEVNPAVIEREREVYKGQVLEMGKPENVADKIVDGKMKKFLADNCLMNQAFVKNPDLTVQDYLNEVIGKTGENIIIRRFARFALGE
ncbi:MAG: translation elongation factor Ts [Desulfatibacillaceae bacterium]|nr:translation elongation factor Ts [Desulfatibacillaceae bacterium]